MTRSVPVLYRDQGNARWRLRRLVRLSSVISDYLIDFPRENVAPYVSGVGNASYSRHSNLMAAYQAYINAYDRSFVSYV